MKISLVQEKSDISVYIDVEITPEGALLFSGQDIGKPLEKIWGDTDYEYFLTIKDKDAFLLAILEKFFSANTKVVTEIMDLLKSKNIPFEFFNY